MRIVLALVAASSVLVAAEAGAWRRTLFARGEGRAMALDGANGVVVAGRTFESGGDDWAVVKFAADTGEVLWQQTIDGGSIFEGAAAVAVDAAGDVYAAGELRGAGPEHGAAVVKLDGASGAEIWRHADPVLGGLSAVAVNSLGKVIGAGYLKSGAASDFLVLGLDATTGAESWRDVIDGGGTGNGDSATAVALDSAGNAVAVGLLDTGSSFDFVTAKLDSASGAEIWRATFAGIGSTVAVDPADDVIIGGTFGGPANPMVRKLSGADGAEIWQSGLSGSTFALAVYPGGDVVAAGDAFSPTTNDDLMVQRISGATGAQVWRRVLDGDYSRSPQVAYVDEVAYDVAIDAAGDVLVAGQMDRSKSRKDFAVIKFTGASGDEIWRTVLDGGFGGEETANAIAIDGSGGVFAAGNLEASPATPGLAAVGLSGVSGSPGPIPAKSILVKDRAGDPTKRRWAAEASRDVAVAPLGSAGDPTLHGATISIFNPATTESASVSLPAGASWQALGTPPGSKGYQYSDPAGGNGPCTLLRARPRSSLKLRCSALHGSLPFSLDEASQGTVVLSVRLGLDQPQCAVFGGSIVKDAGTANPGPAGIFRSRGAAAADGTCPNL